MNEASALEAVVDMVPNWYLASAGLSFRVSVGESELEFRSQRNLTPDLGDWRDSVQRELPGLIQRLDRFAPSVCSEVLQDELALLWLTQRAPTVDWAAVLEYSRACTARTYENDDVCFNLIVGTEKSATLLSAPGVQKLFDPLGASQRTFFRVGSDLSIVSYEEVSWNDVAEPAEYTFHPEFLHPFVSTLGDGEHGVHQTRRGDLIITNASGLLAAKRQGRWKIYDVQTFKNAVVDALGDYWVGANLFSMVFDLSFRRHGALLVFDPRGTVADHVSNRGSLFGEGADEGRSALADSVGAAALGQSKRDRYRKHLLLEMASVDGALIFNADAIVGFGCMIKSHESVSDAFGARTTAAESAFAYGATPIKVSSDGDITLYFRTKDANGNEQPARLKFL